MTPAQRREGRISFAMLPIGVVLVVAAALGSVAVLAFALLNLATQDGNWSWYVAWCTVAFGLGLRNLVRSLRNMSALDIRGTMLTIGISAAIVAAFPGWWL